MQTDNINDHTTFELQISSLLSQMLLSGALGGILRYFSHMLLKRATYGTYVFMAVIIAEIFFIFIVNKRGKKLLMIVAYSVAYIAVMYLFYILFPATRVYYAEYLDDLIYIALISIPGYYAIKNVKDPLLIVDKSKTPLRICAVLMPVIYILGAGEYFGFMSWGSRMLPVSLLYALYNNKNGKPIDKILLLISIVLTAMGGRQSLVLMVTGLVIAHFSGKRTKNKTIRMTLFLLISIILLLFYSNVLSFINMVMISMNIQSRSLSALVSGTLFDSSNRIGIYTRCVEIIKRNGTKVSGLFADRLYLRKYRSNIAYSHNIILEILIDFGAVFGSLLIGYTIIQMVKKWHQIKIQYRLLYIQLFIICVARLFVSSSLLISYNLPLFFGFVGNYLIIREDVNRKRIRLRLK